MGNRDSAIYSIFRSEGGGLTVEDIKASIGSKTQIINALKKEFINQASSTISKSKNTLIKARLDPENYLLSSGEDKIDPYSTIQSNKLDDFSVIEYKFQGPKTIPSGSSKLKIVVEIGGIKCLPVKVTCVSSDSTQNLIEYLKLVCSELIDRAIKTNEYSNEEWVLTLEGEKNIQIQPSSQQLKDAEIEHDSKLMFHHPSLKMKSTTDDDLIEVNFKDMNGNTETIRCSPDKPFRLASIKYKKLVGQNNVNHDIKFFYKNRILNINQSLNEVGFDPDEDEDIMVSTELE